MNDIENCLTNSQIKLYADDAKIYFCYKNATDVRFLQQDLHSIADWASLNGLSIAFHKCFALQLGSRNASFVYEINDHHVAACEAIRDLGVFVTPDVKFSLHCSDLAAKCFRKVNAIFRSFTCHSVDLLLKLYFCFVRSVLEYCTEVWSPYLVRDVDIIERVQQLFVRRLPGFSDLSGYDVRLRKLGLRSLELRRVHRDLVMVYKIYHGLVDLKFDDFFTQATSSVTRGHSKRLLVNRSRLEIRRNFFSERTVKYWNSLPQYLVDAPTASSFKAGVSRLSFGSILGGRVIAAEQSAHHAPSGPA
jgi:hypothetical protein